MNWTRKLGNAILFGGSKMKVLFLYLAILIFSLGNCKKIGRPDLEEIAANPKFSDEYVFAEVAKKVFGNQLKEFRYATENGKKIVSIEFGANSALTFQISDNYEKDHKLVMAAYQVRFLQPLQKRSPDVLVMSLVKPFYVKEEQVGKELIEEFEIFRARLEINPFSKIPDVYSVNPNTNEEKEKKLQILEEVQKLWKIELNEFKRIELQ